MLREPQQEINNYSIPPPKILWCPSTARQETACISRHWLLLKAGTYLVNPCNGGPERGPGGPFSEPSRALSGPPPGRMISLEPALQRYHTRAFWHDIVGPGPQQFHNAWEGPKRAARSSVGAVGSHIQPPLEPSPGPPGPSRGPPRPRDVARA